MHSAPQVIVNERAVRAIAVINTGSLAFDFEWDAGLNPRVAVRVCTPMLLTPWRGGVITCTQG